ncbi:hypothetical protein ACNI3T_04535 [Christiangramia sp. ASW11-125]|uniref:hypothetical protein n=1 Tax=Christiangramia sp. ASW11-125 TaxID=3400701 RepID=UPI003AAE7829
MKNFSSTLLLIILCLTVQSQNPTNSGNLSDGFKITRSSPKGDPFLSSEWYVGYGINKDGSTTRPQQMNYDIYGNNLVYKTGTNGEPMKLLDDSISGFILKDKNTELLFSKIEGSKFEKTKREDRYYHVVSPPSNYVIVEYIKDLNDPNASGWVSSKDNTLSAEYELDTNYYILNRADQYVEVRLKRNHILKALKDRKDQLKTYIDSNNIDFESILDLVKILEYYYTL